MNLWTVWLPPQITHLFTLSLVVVTLLIGITFSPGQQMQASARSLTPEANEYQVDEAPTIDLDNEHAHRSQQNLKNTADNIREKLNLDQPLYPGTKEFINDVQDKAGETIEGTQRALENAADTVTGN